MLRLILAVAALLVVASSAAMLPHTSIGVAGRTSANCCVTAIPWMSIFVSGAQSGAALCNNGNFAIDCSAGGGGGIQNFASAAAACTAAAPAQCPSPNTVTSGPTLGSISGTPPNQAASCSWACNSFNVTGNQSQDIP